MNHFLPATSYVEVSEYVRKMKVFYLLAEAGKTGMCWMGGS